MLTAHYHRAGNPPLDSTAYPAEGVLGLSTLRALATPTALEFSRERNEPFAGAQCVEAGELA